MTRRLALLAVLAGIFAAPGGLLGPLAPAFPAVRAPVARAAVSLWPPTHFAYSEPGEAATVTVHLANGAAEPRDVSLRLTDWEPPPSPGGLLPAGAGSRSLAPYIIDGLPERLTLAPGERRDLSLTVVRPAGDEGTRWVSVTAETDLPGPEGDAASPEERGGVRVRRRMQSRLFHTPLPAPTPRGSVTALRSRRDPAPGWVVTYDNPTNRVFAVGGRWRLTAASGATVASGGVYPFAAYPGETTAFIPAELPALPGTYHLLVVLEPVDGPPEAARAGQLVLRAGEGGAREEGGP